MKEGYIIRDQAKAHFITMTVVDWIDVFSRSIDVNCNPKKSTIFFFVQFF